MKTLQIGMGWLPEQAGGLNRFYYDFAQYLPQVGVEMRGLVAGSANVVQSSGGQVQAFAPHESSLWERLWKVRQAFHRLLREDNYPLVVSHFALYTLPILDLVGSRPLVMHFHGPWAREGYVEGGNKLVTWLKLMLEQTTYSRMTSFIVLSQAFRNVLHSEYGVPFEDIYVIPSGVDTECFQTTETRREARSRLNWPLNRPIILAVRRLAKRMGLENLIAAIDIVRKRYPEILLLLAGKGALEPNLKSQIEALGLHEHVRLLGFISERDLVLAYRAADFTVVPSLVLEGFGLIVVESLAAGTPVLGTPVGGIPEILRPFSEDLVMEGTSVEQLAQGILEALSGQRKLPSSEECEAYVQEHYAWPEIAIQLKSVYQAALDG